MSKKQGKNTKKQRQIQREKEQKKKEQRKIIVMVTSVVFLLVFGVLVAVMTNGGGSSAPSGSGQDQQENVKQNINVKGQPSIGQKDAPVTVVEFGDYSCHFCKEFDETIYPKIYENYIKTGKVQFYFINNTILGEGSRMAANAAEAIYENHPKHFWDFHHELYDRQASEDGSWVSTSLLVDVAKKTVPNLDVSNFKWVLEQNSFEDAVSSDKAMAGSLGVKGTPVVFVDGKRVEFALKYDSVKSAIEQTLNDKEDQKKQKDQKGNESAES